MAGEAEIGSVIARLKGDNSELRRTIRESQGDLRGVGDTASRVSRRATIAFAAIGAAAVAGFVAARKAYGELLDQFSQFDKLAKLRQQLGLSTETLSALGLGAKLAGSDLDSLATGLGVFSRKLLEAQEPTSRSARLVSDLGIQGRTTEESLARLADVIASLPDGQTKTAIAMEFLGRSGARLIPMLNRGSAGLREMRAEAERLGIVIDLTTAQSAEELNDDLERLSFLIDGFKQQLAISLLPTLERIVDRFEKWAEANRKVRDTLPELEVEPNFNLATGRVLGVTPSGKTVEFGPAVGALPRARPTVPLEPPSPSEIPSEVEPGGPEALLHRLMKPFGSPEFRPLERPPARSRPGETEPGGFSALPEPPESFASPLGLGPSGIATPPSPLPRRRVTEEDVRRALAAAEDPKIAFQGRLDLAEAELERRRTVLAVAQQELETAELVTREKSQLIPLLDNVEAAEKAVLQAEIDRLEVSRETPELLELQKTNAEAFAAAMKRISAEIEGIEAEMGMVGDRLRADLVAPAETFGDKLVESAERGERAISDFGGFAEGVFDDIARGIGEGTLGLERVAQSFVQSAILQGGRALTDRLFGQGGALNLGGTAGSQATGALGQIVKNQFGQRFGIPAGTSPATVGVGVDELGRIPASALQGAGGGAGAGIGAAGIAGIIIAAVTALIGGLEEIQRQNERANAKGRSLTSGEANRAFFTGSLDALGLGGLGRGLDKVLGPGVEATGALGDKIDAALFTGAGAIIGALLGGPLGSFLLSSTALLDKLNIVDTPSARKIAAKGFDQIFQAAGLPRPREFLGTHEIFRREQGVFGFQSREEAEAFLASLSGPDRDAAKLSGKTVKVPKPLEITEDVTTLAGIFERLGIEGELGGGRVDVDRGLQQTINALNLAEEDTRKLIETLGRTATGNNLHSALIQIQADLADGKLELKDHRNAVLDLVDIYLGSVKAIDTARLATVAFGEDGKLAIEALTRQLEDAQTAIVGGLGAAFDELLETGDSFQAGETLAEQFGAAFNARLKERLITEGILGGPEMTEALALFSQAAEALSAGDVPLFRSLIAEGGEIFQSARADAEAFFAQILPFLDEANFALGLPLINTPRGIIDQTGSGRPGTPLTVDGVFSPTIIVEMPTGEMFTTVQRNNTRFRMEGNTSQPASGIGVG